MFSEYVRNELAGASTVAPIHARPSTGLPHLDGVLRGILAGDNIVWQVHSIGDYAPFVEYCSACARKEGQRVVYLRFAKHEPLIAEGAGVEVRQLHPEDGFEWFITEIHDIIHEVGDGGYYIFDCMSELAADWCSDRMLGNFFMLTCPHLHEHGAIAYFGVLRNCHSFHATIPIRTTTQVLIDVYRHRDELYIHPLRVLGRHSGSMYMLHHWKGSEFKPVTQSVTVTEILGAVPWSRLDSASYRLGYWSSAFADAEELQAAIDRGEEPEEDVEAFVDQLLRMAISRDERIFRLAKRHFSLSDIIEIRRRMIGTGLIGGKSVGMLLARAILREHNHKGEEILAPHDSFFIGADVFYTYLVQNGMWWMKQAQKHPETYLAGAEDARRKMLEGAFPEYIVDQFVDMLDYFGQSPIIVRSSSLLEDNFGNAFAGKYESVFCVNQASREKRLEEFLAAVRTVYASTMSEKALTYRARRGMLARDEQMALLVQRVSGGIHGKLFYPHLAGVGFSYNPYVWSKEIDPNAGVLRLVFGLGTRAVDRHDDDYTRVVALNAPERRPVENLDEVYRYSQRYVDVLDLQKNELAPKNFNDVAAQSPDVPVDVFASQDTSADTGRGNGRAQPWFLTFETLLKETGYVSTMREMLKDLQEAYDYPVDVEFTANFLTPDAWKINLLQCRPLQVQGGGMIITDAPEDIAAHDLVIEGRGAVIGKSRILNVDRIIYVAPEAYSNLAQQDRYAVARLVGRLAHIETPPPETIMLLGPGRWGTSTPALGIPVSFAEINTVAVLGEIVAMHGDLVPDVSLGTHFFCEMVEGDMLCFAIFPGREGNMFNQKFIESAPNRLPELLPDEAKWADTVRVIDPSECDKGTVLKLHAHALQQRVVCYWESGK